MPSIGEYESKRTGIVREFRVATVNGDTLYMTKIDDRIYKFSEDEFKKIWRKYKPRVQPGKQGELL